MPRTDAGRALRTDAQRNRNRILAAAEAEFARHGAGASLEEIARQAGVGSATLHRHFASRRALLHAVFHDRTAAICAHAGELANEPDPGQALVTWLRALGVHLAMSRGLAASMLDMGEGIGPEDNACHQMVSDAGEELLRRARQAGDVRPDVSIGDLITLVNAISLATERHPADADRLVSLAVNGIRNT